MFGFDLVELVRAGGYLGLTAIIFAESGLFFGFFLPGDSLLFTAGFLASQGFLNIWILVPLLFVAAVLGDQVGYWFGARVGERLYARPDSRFFKREHLERTKSFFAKHGHKAILFARFVPVVRTFTPILAGVGSMPYRIFVSYNIIGGALWAIGVTLLGYFLGAVVPNAERYLVPIVLIIIASSFIPIIKEWYTAHKSTPR